VLPLSALKPGDKVYPTEVLLTTDLTGLPKDSVAMVQQVRTVAHTRLDKLSGRLEDAAAKEQILEAIRMYFEV
jgi:mRNA-degrading endonuclease toxin of MazEF toxin-antitoxin module